MPDYSARRLTMVDTQVRPSDVTKLPIIDALLSVRRELFVPEGAREAAYVGDHVALGSGRVLLEARTFAKLLDALDLSPEHLVLDIGAGFGYSAAVLGRMVQAVVAIEEDAGFASEAQGLLADEAADNVAYAEGALTEGAADQAPYDVILIEGGVETLPPALLDQLAEGGRIAAIFMDGPLGVVRIGYKIDGAVTWRDVFNATAPVLPGFEKEAVFAL